MRNTLVGVFFLVAAAAPLHAEVIDVQSSGFTSRNEALIAATPNRVYRTLLRVGRWWDPEHTYSGDARNMSLEPRPGGCFCEKVPGKGAVEHMRVVYLARNSTLRLSGALGPLQELGVSGSLTWSLKAEAEGTRVVQVYNVGGYRTGGFADLAPAVDQVLSTQLQRLKSSAESSR